MATSSTEPILFSIEAESALLGSILINPGAFVELDILPEHFNIHRHQWIWTAYSRLNIAGIAIDYVTVIEELTRMQKLGPGQVEASYLAALFNRTPSSLHTAEYAHIVKDHWRRRQWVEIANRMAKAAYNDKADLDQEAPAILNDLTSSTSIERGAAHISEYLPGFLDELTDRMKDPKDIWGMETGFIDFDKITGGLQAGEVLDISGDPGIGKSIFAIQMGCQLAERDNPGVIYSIEMRAQAVLRRRFSHMASVPSRDLKRGSIDDNQYAAVLDAVVKMEHLPLFMSDGVHWTTTSLRADLARLKAQHKIKWFALDYAYLLQDGSGLSENDRTGMISRALKSICRGLNLAGIVILSKRKEGMGSKTPAGQDVRGSGQQFYDADLILFMVDGGQANVVTCVFGKGRELEAPKQSFDLYKKVGYPAFENAVTRPINVDWNKRKDLA